MSLSLLDEPRERRNTARAAADEILTRAADETRDHAADESRDHAARVTEVRELDDEVEARLEAELAELRAAQTRRPTPDAPRQPVLTREQSVLDWCQTRGLVETTDRPSRSTATCAAWRPASGTAPPRNAPSRRAP